MLHSIEVIVEIVVIVVLKARSKHLLLHGSALCLSAYRY